MTESLIALLTLIMVALSVYYGVRHERRLRPVPERDTGANGRFRVLRRWVGRAIWYTGAMVGGTIFLVGLTWPFVYLMLQAGQWLETGVWQSASTLDMLKGSRDPDLVRWVHTPATWIGLHQLAAKVPAGFAVSGLAVVVGIAVISVTYALAVIIAGGEPD